MAPQLNSDADWQLLWFFFPWLARGQAATWQPELECSNPAVLWYLVCSIV